MIPACTNLETRKESKTQTSTKKIYSGSNTVTMRCSSLNFQYIKDYGITLGVHGGQQGLYLHTDWSTGDDDLDATSMSYAGPAGMRPEHEIYRYPGQDQSDKGFKGSVSKDFRDSWDKLSENKWLLQQTMKQISNLIYSQRAAAAESGYKAPTMKTRKGYFEGLKKDQFSSGIDKVDTYSGQTFQVEENTPYRAYVDAGKAIPTAETYQQLTSQLNSIRNMKDRSYYQQGYLAQKAYTRYLMHQVDIRGGGDALAKSLYTPMKMNYGSKDVDAKKLLKTNINEAYKDQRLHNYDESAQAMLYFDDKEGGKYLPPWYTKDDKGVLPAFVKVSDEYHLKLEKSEANLNLIDARDLPLSHHSSRPPAELLDPHTGKVHKDYRVIDWKAPQNKYTRKFLTGDEWDHAPMSVRKTGKHKKQRQELYQKAQIHDYLAKFGSGFLVIKSGDKLPPGIDLTTRPDHGQVDKWFEQHNYAWDPLGKQWTPQKHMNIKGGKDQGGLFSKQVDKGIKGDTLSNVHSSWDNYHRNVKPKDPPPKPSAPVKPDPKNISWEVFQDPKTTIEDKKKIMAALAVKKRRDEAAAAQHKKQQEYLKNFKGVNVLPAPKPKPPPIQPTIPKPPPLHFHKDTPAERASGVQHTIDHFKKYDPHKPAPKYYVPPPLTKVIPMHMLREGSAPKHIPIHPVMVNRLPSKIPT